MRGCRPLTGEERALVLAGCRSDFSGRRLAALFALGCNTGFRISELLSLNLGDVTSFGSVSERVTVQRRNMKRKQDSRSVKINFAAAEALRAWFPELRAAGGITAETPLFCSKNLKRLSRYQAYKELRAVLYRCGISGHTGTHCMRKSFAAEVYGAFMRQTAEGRQVDPFRMTSKALGHRKITSTDEYLSFREEQIDEVIDGLASG